MTQDLTRRIYARWASAYTRPGSPTPVCYQPRLLARCVPLPPPHPAVGPQPQSHRKVRENSSPPYQRSRPDSLRASGFQDLLHRCCLPHLPAGKRAGRRLRRVADALLHSCCKGLGPYRGLFLCATFYLQNAAFLKWAMLDLNQRPPPCKGGSIISWLFADVQKLLQISAFALAGHRGCSLLSVWVGVKWGRCPVPRLHMGFSCNSTPC